MNKRILANGLSVSTLGLGCMGMSEFYGAREDTESMAVLHRAVELGVDFFDTADIYGPHHNEELIARFLKDSGAQVKIAVSLALSESLANMHEPSTIHRSMCGRLVKLL